jgi:hypothetical protein
MRNPASLLLSGALIVLIFVAPTAAYAQCFAQITHISGTETVGCVDVTVTAAGTTGNLTACGAGPYFIGGGDPGSYTFSFSQPLLEVFFEVAAINNSPTNGLLEEVFVYVDGVQYALPNAGNPIGACGPQAELTGAGTLIGPLNNVGDAKDVRVTGPMNSITIECQHNGALPTGTGVLFGLNICCCVTQAGAIDATPLNICRNDLATLAEPSGTLLESDDLLQYILFSNLANIRGSILATSNTPEFTFNPATMTVGTTYYIAAIAGNNLNGNVDTNDPCFDVTNAISVTWNALPAVTFSIANVDICAGDCSNLVLNFTGSPPFSLTYSVGINPPVTQTFNSNSATIQVCIPEGTAPGNLVMLANELSDANCTCN